MNLSLKHLTGVSALVLSLSVGPATGAEVILYETDFSSFSPGENQLVGNEGWESTHPDQGLHGIDNTILEDGNESGFLGFKAPSEGKLITLFRPLDYDPIAEGKPHVNFSVNLAVVDSTAENEHFDSFHFSIYNRNVELLAGITFNNDEADLPLLRYDGNELISTGSSFKHAILTPLDFSINFETNRWSAAFDGISLFENEVFSDTDRTLDLGDISAEWDLTDEENPGNNWIVFDDWKVSASDTATEQPEAPAPRGEIILRITRRPNGNVRLSFKTDPNVSYQIEYSNDLVDWKSDLPNSTVSTAEPEASFMDRTARGQRRYYRIRQ